MAVALVIDDDRAIREMVKRSLAKDQIEVSIATTAAEGLQIIQSETPDLVLLDIMLPDGSGLDLFEQIQSLDPHLIVIFITALSDIETTIKAVQLGAFDYLTKPLDLTELRKLVLKAIESRRMMKTPVALPIGDSNPQDADQFIGRSDSILQVFKSIGRVADSDVTVLIQGESGTGKELVSRAIFQHSPRVNKPFIAINCAALPDTLLESELFGHEKGSFTGAETRRIGKFEQCNGGTILLDEIGDMSPLSQGKILRLLQEQKFERVGGNETIETDVRIIAATNRDLQQRVEKGEFREDLFYRLNEVTIHLSPLRERKQDIEPLVEHYLSVFCRNTEFNEIEGVSPEALEMLKNYSWPGNVRELKNAIRQAVLNCSGTAIVPQFLPQEIQHVHQDPSDETAPDHAPKSDRSGQTFSNELPESDMASFVDARIAAGSTDLYAEVTEMMERFLISRVLAETGGNQSQASEMLGITRGKIRDRITRLEISLEQLVNLKAYAAKADRESFSSPPSS